MSDFAPDAFTIFGNFNKDQKKDGHYWAMMDVPLDELRKLFEWAKTAERYEDIRGQECVKLRANLMPRIAKETGNDYLMMALSDAKPRTADKPRIDF
tara:strand:- start:64 stop:354 length:291 start_codon:yes stop_codon:yes gene_type:complete